MNIASPYAERKEEEDKSSMLSSVFFYYFFFRNERHKKMCTYGFEKDEKDKREEWSQNVGKKRN